MKKKRIAYVRIAQETHAFSPELTTMTRFAALHLEGEALAKASGLFGNEAPGLTPIAELSGFRRAMASHASQIETVPLFSLWAMAAGPLTEETYQALRERLRSALEEAGPLDGVYFAMHGAMRAQGAEAEPEAGLLEVVREVVGVDTPVAVSLDLHAQLGARLVALCDLIVGYRTNPHRDLFGTGRRAGGLLARMILGEVRPTTAWRALPMVLGGGSTVDLMRPMRGVFRALKRFEQRPGVLDVSLFMCHIWNDSPDLGWAAYAITDDAPELAEEIADAIAELAWAVRDEAPPGFSSPAEAIEGARARPIARRLGTICFTDASDVVGAGSTGENTHLLRALLEQGQGLISYVPLRDAEAVDALWRVPEGEAVDLEVGGRLDPVMNPPVLVRGRMLRTLESPRDGRMVALDLGHVKLVLTERAPFTLKPSFYGQIGLKPWRADIHVIKSFFHFRIFYAWLMRAAYVVQTRGLTDLHLIEEIDFNDPVHPLDTIDDWRVIDRRRRGLAPI